MRNERVDVNVPNDNGDTAFLRASSKGQTEIVATLLNCGKVDLNLPTLSGDTALFLASIHGHTDIVWHTLKHNPSEALSWVTAKRTICKELR
jgi:ankyrin repeat protein